LYGIRTDSNRFKKTIEKPVDIAGLAITTPNKECCNLIINEYSVYSEIFENIDYFNQNEITELF